MPWRRQISPMGDVLPFKRPASKPRGSKDASKGGKGNTLCKNGFHKWKAVKETRFDVKQGKLLTLSRCERCGKEKLEKT